MTENIEIQCMENGPISIKKNGKVVAALCRCGESSKKPYCDGTHYKRGFKAGPSKVEIK
jgi:CDGSH-type Zn-finger protein